MTIRAKLRPIKNFTHARPCCAEVDGVVLTDYDSEIRSSRTAPISPDLPQVASANVSGVHPTTTRFAGCRVGLFEPYAHVVANPSLVNIVQRLLSLGASVDLFMREQPSTDPPLPLAIDVYPFPRGDRFKRYHVPLRVRQHIQRTRWHKAGWHPSLEYDLILGADPPGIIRAEEYARRSGAPLVYLSYEIFFRRELTSKAQLEQKDWECRASRAAALVVVQDERRGELLANENGLDSDRFVYLPVAPSVHGSARRTRLLHDRFKIDRRTKIVLHAGSFRDSTYADELIESLDAWPDDVALVVHTRARPDEDDPYVRKARHSGRKNVVLSTEPLAASEYENLIAAADIGLALYKQIPGNQWNQSNIRHIGLSSGKFAYYMKYGLPTICVGETDFHELLRKYPFGESLRSMADLPEALARVAKNYQTHSVAARRLFTEQLAFETRWPAVETRLLALLSGGS
jgi:hypothetical protein